MIDKEPPRPGDFRIVENTAHHMGPDWAFRYRVQELRPGGKFWFWSWPEKWVDHNRDEMQSTCINLINHLKGGTHGTSQVVSYHKGNR